MHPNTETFLDRVTTGLASDPELRLDVQAELRAHVADKLAELGDEEHADEAVASLGEVVELAEEVAAANQRRLGARHLARRVLRFGLVPTSIVCAIWFSGLRDLLVARQFSLEWNGQGGDAGDGAGWFGKSAKHTPQERLVLYGDPSRKGSARYRTLWDRNPTDRVYCGYYITQMEATGPARLWEQAPVSSEEYDRIRNEGILKELTEAQTVDPLNSRYPRLAAMALARAAAPECIPAPGTDGKPTAYTLEVSDRAALDRAMADLLAATALPEYHCYHLEMLRRKFAVLGPSECMVDNLRRASLTSVLLPDLAEVRQAARYSLAYADLLIAEGRQEEAIPFLSIPENLGRKVAEDSFCLVEMLVSHALTSMGRETVPKTLRQIGHEAEAQAAETRLAPVIEPMQEWRESRKRPNPELDELIASRAGVVATVLLPALGWQDVAVLAPQLAASRRTELTAATRAVVGLVGLLLVVAMLVCVVISLRWRLTLGRQSAPLLLLPSGRDLLRFVLLGVILPFAVFLAWTHWLPFSGHAYSFKYAGHRITAEFVALLATLLFLPAWLALRTFRRRCAELELPPPPRLSRLVYWPLGLSGLLLVVGFAMPLGAGFGLGQSLVGISGAILVLLLLGLVGVAFFAPRRHGRALGTLSRSLIPVFATAILLLALTVQPLLRRQERRLLRSDTILGLGSDEPGFTRMGTELTNRLRDATLKAMAENPMPPITPQ